VNARFSGSLCLVGSSTVQGKQDIGNAYQATPELTARVSVFSR
jgi:hypothetical protein